MPKGQETSSSSRSDKQAVMVDLKFIDFLGLWQHLTYPDRASSTEEASRRASASTARRSAAGSAINASATC